MCHFNREILYAVASWKFLGAAKPALVGDMLWVIHYWAMLNVCIGLGRISRFLSHKDEGYQT